MILRINFKNREIKSYEIIRVQSWPVGYYVVLIQFSTETSVVIWVAMVTDARFV
ncbi:hypothetical protein C0J52_09070 [Blattella germanica]|nr:hypothetical protein C0J52_09070 [Blattella germanica]